MKNTMSTYEEKTLNMDYLPIFGDSTSHKEKKEKTYSYKTEAIKEAFKAFVTADKKKNLSKKTLRFFYDKASVNILIESLKKENLIHKVGYRDISQDNIHNCFEVNFQIVLDRTKPEIF